MAAKQCICWVLPAPCPVHRLTDEQLREIAEAWKQKRRRRA